MKRMIILLAAIAGYSFRGSAADALNTVEADSRISAVIVYEDRAQVERTADVQLKEGENAVVFTHLPATIIEDSIRASGKGAMRVKIADLEIERVYLKEAAEKKVRDLKEKIQELADKDKELSYRLGALKEQRDFVTSIRMGTTDRISKELLAAKATPEEWEKVSAFIRRSMDGNAGERLKVEIEQRENRKEIDALQRDLRQISADIKEEKAVTVSLDAEKGGPFTIDLSYMCRGARWVPLYDARAEEKRNEVELTYKGAVIQRTGGDWDDVALSLSTARPSVGGRPGELSPWYISLYPAYDKRKFDAETRAMEPAAPARMERGDAYMLMQEEAKKAVAATATAERRGPSVLFKIAKPESIPSDGNPSLVTIAVEKLKADFSYTAVPKINELAFLKARATNGTSYPFLAGKMNIFLGPDFIGSSSIEDVAEDEEFDLYLGPDEGIKIDRVLAEEKTDKTFGIRKKGRKTFRYTIEVENLLKDEARITVKDQIPVSQSPEITVSLASVRPEPVEKPEKEMPGLLEWELRLDPKGKETIEFSLSVEYPLGQEPEGL